jgi:hypothetical protein
MKGIKYLMAALAIVAVLTTVGWLLRNSLIERISNPLLADYDVELIDVSLDALATSAASISYLELVHAKGTQIVIEDLKLPISASGNSIKTYSAQKVSIVTSTRDEGASLELARLINQFLSLTDNFAGNEIHIVELSLAPYPSVRDLRWTLSDTEQRLGGTVESVRVSTMTRRIDEENYDVGFSLPREPDSDNVTDAIKGKLQLTDTGVSIVGDSMLELPGWQAITKLAGILPEAIELKSGTGELRFEVEIPFDVLQSPSVSATLIPSFPWQIGYVGELGDSTDVLLRKGSSVDINATFPKVEWSLQQADATLLVTSDEWRNIPLSVSELSCVSGPVCSAGADISWLDAETPIGNAAHVEFSSILKLSFPVEGVRIDVHPDASIEFSGFSSLDNAIDRVAAHLVSAAEMQLADDGWQFSAASIDAKIESLALNDDITITSALFLENVEARERDGIVSASTGIVAPSFQAGFDGRDIALPGIRGEVSLQDANVAFDLATVDLFKNGTIKGQHNLDSGIGEVAILETELTLSGRPLSTRVSPWKFDFDISAGKLATDVHAKWAPANSGTSFDAQSSIKVEEWAGFYTDTVFTGLSTELEVNYNDVGISVDPTTISVGLIDMGVTVEDITADVALNVDELAVDVRNLEMTAFNGVISAAPFSFHTGRPVNTIILTAKAVELAELLAIKEFAAVDVTGTMGALLPITIEEDGVSIDGGKLTGEPPGGVIRYLGGGQSDDTEGSSIGLAMAALSNFEYETLTSDVTYNKDGDLKLQMQLKGRNPELGDGRPVVLNLGVDNNIPQMLKSLKAGRAVEEILENRLAR